MGCHIISTSLIGPMTRMNTLWWKVIGGWYQHHENTSFVKQIICGLIESPYKNELIHASGLLALS